MKKIKNKILKWLLVVVYIFSAFQPLIAQAATPNLVTKVYGDEWISGIYIKRDRPGGYSNYQQARWLKRTVDNHYVYCMQPGVAIDEDITYYGSDSDWASVAGLTQTQWQRIMLIAYYGYEYGNHTSVNYYVAAQMMIWRTVEPTWDIYYTDSLNGNRVTGLASYEAEIEALIANHNVRPSFNNTSRDMVIGETITLTDTNGVLSNYEVSSNSYVSASKNGNNLSITANAIGTTTLSLTKKDTKYNIPPIVYINPYSQDVMTAGSYDPIPAQLNIRIYGGKVSIIKLDKETGIVPQGDAILKGATYGIYNNSTGAKVGTITTDQNGKVTSDYLPSLGTFYLLEEKASLGYELDPTKYYFDITKEDLEPTVNVYEQVIKRKVELFKVYATDKTAILTGEQNVTFEFYLKSSGKLLGSATTDKNGRLEITLPYGVYTVKQKNTSVDHEKVDDFEIVIDDYQSNPIYKLLSNAEIKARLRVIKIDQETKNTIPVSGIQFKIFDVTNNKYVCQTITYPVAQEVCVYETDSKGTLMTPYPLSSGNYKLEEVDQKLDGYLWNDVPLEFRIGENVDLINDVDYGVVLEVKFENSQVKGNLDITKKGEEVILENDTFTYEEIALKEVKFGLYAFEDIIINGHKYFSKDELIATLVTDEKGKITYDNLPLGKYYLVELETKDNHVKDPTVYFFELKYQDQYTSTINQYFELKNYLKKGNLDFTKTDLTSGKPIADVEIEIYTENDQLIFKGLTDKNGKVKIENLFIGKFYIIETMAATGYKLSDEKVLFEIKDNGEIIKATMTNEKFKGGLEFTKVDLSTGEPLPNTKICIYKEDGTEVFCGVTDENGKIIVENLEYGKYYILEKEAPAGYILNEEKMWFEILEDGQIIKSTMENEKMPKTFNTEQVSYYVILGTALIGIGLLIYEKKKRK